MNQSALVTDSKELDILLTSGTVPNIKGIETVWMIYELGMFFDQR